MLAPYPADAIGVIVLIFSEPDLAFLANDIENLSPRNRQHSYNNIGRIGISAYLSRDIT